MLMPKSILSHRTRRKESQEDSKSNMGRRRKLYCINGQYLEITDEGRVKGTRNYHSPHVVLELVPVARDLIHIRGVHTGFYLAVNKCGEVYTTMMKNEECIFREKLTRNFYDSYCSHKYSRDNLVLGLMKIGAAVTTTRSERFRKEHEGQFITMITF